MSDIELLDQILDREQRSRDPGDPSNVQVRLVNDDGDDLEWVRFADRKPGQLERTLEYLKKLDGKHDSKPPPPRPPDRPPRPPTTDSNGRRWPRWATITAIITIVLTAGAKWVGTRITRSFQSALQAPSAASSVGPPVPTPNGTPVVGEVVEPNGTVPPTEPQPPVNPERAPAAPSEPIKNPSLAPRRADRAVAKAEPPVEPVVALSPPAPKPAPAPAESHPIPANQPSPATAPPAQPGTDPCPLPERFTKKMPPPNDLLHLFGWRDDPPALTPEESHQRAICLAQHPELQRKPSYLPGTEVWKNYPDGGRERVQ